MARTIRASVNGYGRPCLRIRVAKDYEVSVAFRDDGNPEDIIIFARDEDGDFENNVTDALLEDESKGNGEIRVDDFEDILRIVDRLTPEPLVEEVDFGYIKRTLVKLGHRLALAEEALLKIHKPGPSFKALKAKTSIIDAIVEVGHILDVYIEKVKV